jgi:hypothetical protein
MSRQTELDLDPIPAGICEVVTLLPRRQRFGKRGR